MAQEWLSIDMSPARRYGSLCQATISVREYSIPQHPCCMFCNLQIKGTFQLKTLWLLLEFRKLMVRFQYYIVRSFVTILVQMMTVAMH